MVDERQIPHLQVLMEGANRALGEVADQVDLAEFLEKRVRPAHDLDEVAAIGESGDAGPTVPS